jgi:hypothetical protein
MKEMEKERLKQAKETAKRDKQLVKSVNTLRHKSQTVKEMTLDLSSDFRDRNGGELMAHFAEIGVEVQYRDLPRTRCILVSRKVDRLWDEDTQMWTPCDIYTAQEPYVLLLMDGYELAQIVADGLPQFHSSTKNTFPDRKFVYLIQDLDKFYADKKKLVNQSFTLQVRQEAPARQSKKAKERAALLGQLPDAQKIEEELLDLQMISRGDIFINRIPGNQTASWIQTFVVEISVLPETLYRSQEALNFEFGDKIKSGSDLKDTWLKIIQACHWVTEERARAVTEKYPTFASLYKAYKALDPTQGEQLLANLKVRSVTVH